MFESFLEALGAWIHDDPCVFDIPVETRFAEAMNDPVYKALRDADIAAAKVLISDDTQRLYDVWVAGDSSFKFRVLFTWNRKRMPGVYSGWVEDCTITAWKLASRLELDTYRLAATLYSGKSFVMGHSTSSDSPLHNHILGFFVQEEKVRKRECEARKLEVKEDVMKILKAAASK